MTYSNTLKEKVENAIDDNTKDYLDNYTRDTLKKIAKEEAEKGTSTPITVADAVFDYAYLNNVGNIVEANMCQQIIPKSNLFVLRNEIIKEFQ